jgi:translocation and assembly module TamB
VEWSRIAELTGETASGPATFEASADGDVTVRGPLLNAAQLSGSVTVPKLNVTTIPRARGAGRITIANQGPIQIALDRGTVRIQSAHLTGPKMDVQATGTAGINGGNLNLNINANADLGIVQNFDRAVYSQGTVALTGTVRGNAAKPLVNGQLTIQNVAFSTEAVPIGISNANGAIVFSGNTARIRDLTAESGGGKLTLAGFASYTDMVRFGLRADANNVRVRVQQGVSVTADAAIRLSGTTNDSRINGTVTVDRVSYAPQSDFGSILTRSAPPVQNPETPSALLSKMKLDIRVRNSPGMTVQSSLSENLQTDIDLSVRGTAQEPGVTGRINVSEGKLLFFGTTYTVNTGTIAFYNPVQIEPVLNVSLAAQAQGVNVTLQVTGPVDNMKLSYTSDPPLQFQEIVQLLASGKTPTSDPTLLANQPTPGDQGLQQMGESAILGQAVANPVANQLQRVFGVTQLKIDPSFTTGSNVPTARMALQQRITNNLTFTYVSAIDQPNASVVRVEWAFSPQWSAVATRDYNGIFSVNFYYKRQFH